MTIDLAVEKKLVLTVEELSSLRLMLRVDLVYKTQTAMAGMVKGITKSAVKATQEKADALPVEKIDKLADDAAQTVTSTVSDFVDDWDTLNHPLVRAMELAGLTEATAKPESRVAVFLSGTVYDKLKSVVLSGFYNAIRTTNIEDGQPSDTGAALGQAIMKSRANIVAAFNAAEVPAQDLKSGLFTFTQPSPKGTMLN
jgi:predicted DNA-binding protein (UPF0251 family)